MTISSISRRGGRLYVGTATALTAVVLFFGTAGAASAATPSPVGLGTAGSYEVLAGTTVTNTGPSVVTDGDLGVFPGTAVTGFPPGILANGVIHSSDAQAENAKADLVTAFNDAAGRTPDESGIVDLSGRTLVPGVYSGGALSLTGTVTLSGSASSVFIFQAASTLITSSSSTVAFTGGANQCNVFWQVGSSATLGTNSVFVGTVMALTSITANTGAHVTGRLLARNGAVTLDNNTITRSTDCATRTSVVGSTPSSAVLASEVFAATAATNAAAATAATNAATATAATNAAAATAAKTTAAKTTATKTAATKTAAVAAAAKKAAAARTAAAALATTGADHTETVLAGGLLLALGGGLVLAQWRLRRRAALHRR